VPNRIRKLEYIALPDFPEVKEGDLIAELIASLIAAYELRVEDGDVIVIAQKIISKSEGRKRNLENITPGKKALKLADITGKDPRFIELVLQESRKVIRAKENTLIVEHKNGFICANAGIDHSNMDNKKGLNSDNEVLLLPENPDESAKSIRTVLERIFHKTLGVLIIDSHGRAWRNGTVGIAIGLSGLPGLVDLRGKNDRAGYQLRITTVGAADELAAGASLLMGQSDEGCPVVLVKGFPYELRESSLSELIRPESQDLFR